MLNKIGTFTVSAAICLVAQGLLSLPASPTQEPQVPRLTLQIPYFKASNSTSPTIPPMPLDWCKSADARATGKPFGLNKVRYTSYNGSLNQERPIERVSIFGCITNNSGQIIGDRYTTPSGFDVESYHRRISNRGGQYSEYYPTITYISMLPHSVLPGQTAIIIIEPGLLYERLNEVMDLKILFIQGSPRQQVNITFIK